MEQQVTIQISYVELKAYVKKGIKSPFICSFLTALNLLFQR